MDVVPLKESALPSTAVHQYLSRAGKASPVQVYPSKDKCSGEKAVGTAKLEADRTNINLKRGTQNNSPGSHHLHSCDGTDVSPGSTGVLPALCFPSPFAFAQAGDKQEEVSTSPLQTAVGQARGAHCKPILTQTLIHLQATGHGHRDAVGRRATLATCCLLSHRGGSHRSRPQSLSPHPSAKPGSGCQLDCTCKHDFVLYSRG